MLELPSQQDTSLYTRQINWAGFGQTQRDPQHFLIA